MIIIKGEDLKNKILQVAGELFDENGYSNTSIRNIAEKAGIGRGLLYYYFNKKEEMRLEHCKFFYEKVSYYLNKHVSNLENPYLFFSLIIRCHVYLNSFYTSASEIAERYEIKSLFAQDCKQLENKVVLLSRKINKPIDLEKLSMCIEISLLINNHLQYEKIFNNKDISHNDICVKVIFHGLHELEMHSDEINYLLKESQVVFDSLDKNELIELYHNRNYIEINNIINKAPYNS